LLSFIFILLSFPCPHALFVGFLFAPGWLLHFALITVQVVAAAAVAAAAVVMPASAHVVLAWALRWPTNAGCLLLFIFSLSPHPLLFIPLSFPMHRLIVDCYFLRLIVGHGAGSWSWPAVVMLVSAHQNDFKNSLTYSFCPNDIAFAPHCRLLLLFIFYLFSPLVSAHHKIQKGWHSIALLHWHCIIGWLLLFIFNSFSLLVHIKNAFNKFSSYLSAWVASGDIALSLHWPCIVVVCFYLFPLPVCIKKSLT